MPLLNISDGQGLFQNGYGEDHPRRFLRQVSQWAKGIRRKRHKELYPMSPMMLPNRRKLHAEMSTQGISAWAIPCSEKRIMYEFKS
jgi:hypothetical protein